MMIARWHIDARFGHKQTVVDSLKTWNRDIASQVGWSADKIRILTGSVGAPESRLEVEFLIKDLSELNAAWSKLGTIAAHKQWSKELEPYIVSGSPRWEVLRLVE